MALTIISKHDGSEEVQKMKAMLHHIKEDIGMLCEMIDEAEVKMQEQTEVKVVGQPTIPTTARSL